MAAIIILDLMFTIPFAICLPNIMWKISWQDLIYIVSNKDPEIQFTNAISKIINELGITETNLKQWATERIWICIGISVTIIIGLSLFFVFLNKITDKKKTIIEK